MNSNSQRTYDQVFQHPTPHNLEWRDIRALFKELGEVEEEHNGNLKLTLAGHSVVFKSPSNSDAPSAEQVSQMRRLLRSSEQGKADDSGPHLLVVIDHSEAKIFRTEMKNSVPEQVTPYDPEGHKGHVHSAHDYSGSAEQPNYNAYFEAITKSLGDTHKILIFGSGTGSSSAMDMFIAWLGEHHKKVADRITDTITVDLGHLSEGQLLAKAREIYSR